MANPRLLCMPVNDYQKPQEIIPFTELELCGLTINIASFSHILKRVDFNAIVDYLSLTHIIKSKAEKTFFQDPKELNDLINTGNLVQKVLPKQIDIGKILKVIQRKVLKGTHLLVEVKEIQAGYLASTISRTFICICHINYPLPKTAIRKVEMLADRYILLGSLFFKNVPEKETVVLAIPETCADKSITVYHSSLFTRHQGVRKTYLTISEKYLPNLIFYLRSHMKGCHICQLACNEKPPARQLQIRINPNYIPLARLSMALKVCLDHIKNTNLFCAKLVR